MSKRIFELKGYSSSAIIGENRGIVVDLDKEYVVHLEKLVQKMLPVYDRYHEMLGIPKPTLEPEVLEKATRKVPALFKPK